MKKPPVVSKSHLPEAKRLITAFKREADQFHPTTFSLEYFHLERLPPVRTFAKPNHVLPLWQYYGPVSAGESVERLVTDLQDHSDVVGIPGSKLSCFGVIEYAETERFLRMATRAGALFSEEDASEIGTRLQDEVFQSRSMESATSSGKEVFVTNTNPLSIWLNYLLYYLSLTNPRAGQQRRIYPDPFALSLLALEQLVANGEIGKLDIASANIASRTFSVALSFSGNYRSYVSEVAGILKEKLGQEAIFFDADRQGLLALPNLDLVLQSIFRTQSCLCVVFVSSCYLEKDWCQIEWRAMRDLLRAQLSRQLLIVRFDDSPLEGLLGVDGYIDARTSDSSEVAEDILSRLGAAGHR